MTDNVLKIDEVCRLLGVKRWSIYRKIREEGFPKPLKIKRDRVSVWDADAIAAWVADDRKGRLALE